MLVASTEASDLFGFEWIGGNMVSESRGEFCMTLILNCDYLISFYFSGELECVRTGLQRIGGECGI